MHLKPPPRILLAALPLPAIALVAQRAYSRISGCHPNIMRRLGVHAGKLFCFAPAELPFEFEVRPNSGRVRSVRAGRGGRSDVRISGPLVVMLALAEGRADGDAEFFGRQIQIDGDMEAMLALRNALEDARVDFLRDLAPGRGPLRKPVAGGLTRLRHLMLTDRQRNWN